MQGRVVVTLFLTAGISTVAKLSNHQVIIHIPVYI